jgi:hypothetical protein
VGSNWREIVVDFLNRARLVVLFAGTSAGVRWEIDQVFHREIFVPTILLLPYFKESIQPDRWKRERSVRTNFALSSNRLRELHFLRHWSFAGSSIFNVGIHREPSSTEQTSQKGG